MLVVIPIGYDQLDPAAAQAFAQRIRIVAAIGNHPFRFLPRAAFGLRNPDLGERIRLYPRRSVPLRKIISS